jgi:hypothetical protein
VRKEVQETSGEDMLINVVEEQGRFGKRKKRNAKTARRKESIPSEYTKCAKKDHIQDSKKEYILRPRLPFHTRDLSI